MGLLLPRFRKRRKRKAYNRFPSSMTFKKLIGKLHLWLGLISGLVVFIVAITGCIYAFQDELQDLTQPYRFVEKQQAPYLPPSELQAIAEQAFPGKLVHAVLYADSSRAAQVIFFNYEPSYHYLAYMNQYTGEVLHIHDVDNSFFGLVLSGHLYLWLPDEIGRTVVATATLIFVIMLLSGLYLWWPRNKNGRKQRFSIKWDARWRRKNYDLHNVLGFYVSWIAIILALTGLVWGFDWFANGVYGLASGGKEYALYEEPPSDTTQAVQYTEAQMMDMIWHKMVAEHPESSIMEVHPPMGPGSSILGTINPDAGTFWKMDYRYFDQYSMEELSVNHIWNRYHEATTADMLMRMNYDIHTGAILGLPGKILAFLASLLCASLPITGIMVWWGRKNKEPKKERASKVVNKRKKELQKA